MKGPGVSWGTLVQSLSSPLQSPSHFCELPAASGEGESSSRHSPGVHLRPTPCTRSDNQAFQKPQGPLEMGIQLGLT